MKLALHLLPLAALSALAQQQQQRPQDFGAPLTLDAIPLLGFGTWNLKENCTAAVSWAIQAGYRHIDCAAIYGNEELVGAGIADGLEKTGLKREDLWITSKLWNDHHGLPNRAQDAIAETLAKLGVGYLDLYHMHWPVAKSYRQENAIEYRTTWASMTRLVQAGKTRHIGVCNFSPHQMERLLASTDHPPAVHQMELHPYLQQSGWISWHQRNNIHVTSYSPLAGTNPTYNPGETPPLLQNKVLAKIADKRNCTPAQVALIWGMSRGTSVIPKTSHRERIEENFASTECVLEKGDLEEIDGLGKVRQRYGNPSVGWGVQLFEGLEDSKGQHKKHS